LSRREGGGEGDVEGIPVRNIGQGDGDKTAVLYGIGLDEYPKTENRREDEGEQEEEEESPRGGESGHASPESVFSSTRKGMNLPIDRLAGEEILEKDYGTPAQNRR
jgi:hypothetical protein